jgi:hypothetical protein
VTLSEMDGVVQLTLRDGSVSAPVMATPLRMNMVGCGLVLVGLLSQGCGVRTDRSGRESVWASFATRSRSAVSPAAEWNPVRRVANPG